MILFKNKYNGMKYSEMQEQLLAKALEPIIH